MISAHDANFDVGGGSEFQLGQITSVDYQSNVDLYKGKTSGGVKPAFISMKGADQLITLETTDLATLISAVDIEDGAYFTGSEANIPFQEGVQGGTYDDDAGALLTLSRWVMMIKSLSAEQRGDAMGTLEIVPLWNGSDAAGPVTVDNGVTLFSQDFIAAFTLGPAKVDSMAVQGLKRVEINTNLKYVKREYGGDLFITNIRIGDIEPTMTFTFESKEDLATFTALIKSHTTVTQYFRKRVDGGGLVANATTQHIAVVLTGGLTVMDGINAKGGEDNGTLTVTVHGKSISASATSAVTPGT